MSIRVPVRAPGPAVRWQRRAGQGTAATGTARPAAEWLARGRRLSVGDATGRGSAGARVRIPVARQQRIRQHRDPRRRAGEPMRRVVGAVVRRSSRMVRGAGRPPSVRSRAWETVPRVTCLGGSAPALLFDRPGAPAARPPAADASQVSARVSAAGDARRPKPRCRPVRGVVVQTSGQKRETPVPGDGCMHACHGA